MLRLEPDVLRDLRITTTTARARTQQVPITAPGELRVDEDRFAQVGPLIPGRVVRLLAAEGDDVTAGQTLAELESPEVMRTRATLLQATARCALLEKTLARKKALALAGTVPPREVEEAEAELHAADLELKAARSTLTALRLKEDGQGGSFPLVTPIAGRVLSRSLQLGQLMEPVQTAFRIADLSRLWVRAAVFEREAVGLKPGMQAEVQPAALPDLKLLAKVVRVGPEIQPDSRTAQVWLALPNPNLRLKPGMSARVELLNAPGEGMGILSVPLAAVQRVAEQWVVFIPQGPGVFEVRSIGRGRDLDGEVEVLSGLQAGTELVVEGAFILRASAAKGEGGHAHSH